MSVGKTWAEALSEPGKFQPMLEKVFSRWSVTVFTTSGYSQQTAGEFVSAEDAGEAIRLLLKNPDIVSLSVQKTEKREMIPA